MWCVVWGDGQFNTSHVDILYLVLNNTIAHHCISHNNTTVWVVDLQNCIILNVNIPHNNGHFISIVNTDLALMNSITIVSIPTTILPDLQISDMCVHTYVYNDIYVYSTSVHTVHTLYLCICMSVCLYMHVTLCAYPSFLDELFNNEYGIFPQLMVDRHVHTAHANPVHKGNM